MKEYLYTGLLDKAGSLSIQNVILNFVAACILSLMIYISYRVSHSGAVYSRKFNVSLVMLALVTTLVMNVIGNNIALSLGMVGALSIVRFRTAIKDPRDTAYIFWAIAIGITCGVSDYIMAGIGTETGEAESALKSVEKHLNCIFLCRKSCHEASECQQR